MKYCSRCGHEVEVKIPEGDSLPRHVCPSCQTVHYRNPRMVLGCVAEWQGKILMCKRAIEPRRGYWTVPAGFMENGETIGAAAARETMEEALATVEIEDLLALVDVIHAHQTHIFFRGRMVDESCGVGDESLETELMDEADIPWDDLAFPSVTYALRRYFEDRSAGRREVHITEIGPVRI